MHVSVRAILSATLALCLIHPTLKSMLSTKTLYSLKHTDTIPGNFAKFNVGDIKQTSLSIIVGKNRLKIGNITNHLYLAAILLLTSFDIEQNPGPGPKFPCGVCTKAVKWVQKGICCDSCQQWYHIDCQGMCTQMYQNLGASNVSWECHHCGMPNFSSSIFDTFNLSSHNSFAALSDSEVSEHSLNISISTDRSLGSPITSSSPKQYRRNGMKTQPPLRILTLNCQSIVNKRADLAEFLDRTNPYIIIATESWLTPNHYTSEFFPPSYHVHRKDRTDKRGGGVLIAVRNTITSTHDTTLDVDAEVLWCSIKLQNQKSMAIGAFYRPPNTGAEVLDQLQISLSKFADNCKKNHYPGRRLQSPRHRLGHPNHKNRMQKTCPPPTVNNTTRRLFPDPNKQIRNPWK